MEKGNLWMNNCSRELILVLDTRLSNMWNSISTVKKGEKIQKDGEESQTLFKDWRKKTFSERS